MYRWALNEQTIRNDTDLYSYNNDRDYDFQDIYGPQYVDHFVNDSLAIPDGDNAWYVGSN